MRGIFSNSREVLIGASGLRSSWASVARNSSLRRSASRSASSSSLRSVMSTSTPGILTGRPAGVALGLAARRHPSNGAVRLHDAVVRLVGFTARHGPFERGGDPVQVLGMDRPEVIVQQPCRCASDGRKIEELRELAVREQQVVRDVPGPGRDRARLERSVQPGAGIGEREFRLPAPGDVPREATGVDELDRPSTARSNRSARP